MEQAVRLFSQAPLSPGMKSVSVIDGEANYNNNSNNKKKLNFTAVPASVHAYAPKHEDDPFYVNDLAKIIWVKKENG